MVITIARTCGSGGHDVAEVLSKKLGIPVYDKERLMQEAKDRHCYEEMASFFEEKPVDSLLYAIAMGNSEVDRGKFPFEMIRGLAKEKDLIFIGRCGNVILRDQPDHISVFLHADDGDRIQNLCKKMGMDEKKAKRYMEEKDENRARFHRYYTGCTWGDAREYDLSISTSRLTKEEVAEQILSFLNKCRIARNVNQ